MENWIRYLNKTSIYFCRGIWIWWKVIRLRLDENLWLCKSFFRKRRIDNEILKWLLIHFSKNLFLVASSNLDHIQSKCCLQAPLANKYFQEIVIQVESFIKKVSRSQYWILQKKSFYSFMTFDFWEKFLSWFYCCSIYEAFHRIK